MKRIVFPIMAMVLYGVLLMAASSVAASDVPDAENGKRGDLPRFLVPSAVSQENFPCSRCHNFRAADRTKRKLKEYHSNIELKHAEDQRWCYDCHEGDRLRLQNGRLIAFTESYVLCGQCHGTIYRDWKAGIHGKRSGEWDGDKLYRVCANCHDPHKPRFSSIEPKKPPMKPSDIKDR